MLHPIEVHASAAALPGTAPEGPIDVARVLERRDAFTHHRDDSGQVAWAEGANIEVVRGRARLAGPRRVEVALTDGATMSITARHAVVLATGTSASIPPIPGLAEALPWTSRDATNLTEVPSRVAIIGGGVVACEAATWFNGLGAAVTLIVREDSLLGGREPFVSEIISDRFTALGITVLTGTETTAFRRDAVADTGIGNIHGGPVTIAAGGQTLEVDEVVVAAGRRPNSADLGLEQFALDTRASHGFISTDDHLAVLGVDGSWLYAVGDITGRALLTHMGKYQGRIAGAVIGARAEGRPTEGPHYLDRADHGAVPGVIFTDPQVATVGLTEAQAREKAIAVETLEYDLASVAGASLLRDDYVGRAKLVIDSGSDLILGATFVGADVQELLHSATVAIVGQVTVEDLWHAVPSYPTVSEVWLRLLEQRPLSAWQ
jgi:pyruvate/2-oxoglutarate dehydrogenase complex dihydrolipoamide dehydrogenase (E3) component